MRTEEAYVLAPLNDSALEKSLKASYPYLRRNRMYTFKGVPGVVYQDGPEGSSYICVHANWQSGCISCMNLMIKRLLTIKALKDEPVCPKHNHFLIEADGRKLCVSCEGYPKQEV